METKCIYIYIKALNWHIVTRVKRQEISSLDENVKLLKPQPNANCKKKLVSGMNIMLIKTESKFQITDKQN